ncbi:uncharacterized protein LOC123261345 [Cotesia glomerata]|uniref:uncharacterized protein LOC123261345 n=1 Tax=Cotesia glomerata TaxID=32391 RepID=UPI001D0317B0|nr:uncharacterized protein LOC123261345 [Cotesia glomerata]
MSEPVRNQSRQQSSVPRQSNQTAQMTPEQLTRLINQFLQLQTTQQQRQRPPPTPTGANLFPTGMPNLAPPGVNVSHQGAYPTVFHQATFPNGSPPEMPNLAPVLAYNNNR